MDSRDEKQHALLGILDQIELEVSKDLIGYEGE